MVRPRGWNCIAITALLELSIGVALASAMRMTPGTVTSNRISALWALDNNRTPNALSCVGS